MGRKAVRVGTGMDKLMGWKPVKGSWQANAIDLAGKLLLIWRRLAFRLLILELPLPNGLLARGYAMREKGKHPMKRSGAL